MSDTEKVRISCEQGVMQICINRAEKKNALNFAMYETIRKGILKADDDPDVKVILVRGVADAFSAGNDIADFDDRDPNEASPAAQLLSAMHNLRKPVVAAVSGLAVGIGTTMLLHCDLVYATPQTRFRLPFVDLGLCPEGASSLLIPACAGHRVAAEVLLLGGFFTTQKAIELGLVSAVVDADGVFDYALKKARQLAKKPTKALLLTKQLLKKADHEGEKERMSLEFQYYPELLASPEAKKARNDFWVAQKNRG